MLLVKRIVGTIAATIGVIWAILAAGTRQELWDRAKDWWSFVTTTFGLDRLSPQGVILIAAILIGLWAWDVPQRLWHRFKTRNEPSSTELARQKRARAEAIAYLRQTFDNTARFALGDLYGLINITSQALQDSNDQTRKLAGRLLLEPKRFADNAVKPMLAARDGDFETSLRAWGDLFNRYQVAVWWLNEAHKAAGINPWSIQQYGEKAYEKWRELDGRFIEAMKTLEHMEGCDVIVPLLHTAGWGAESRPSRLPG
jgi:hypothetical protein